MTSYQEHSTFYLMPNAWLKPVFSKVNRSVNSFKISEIPFTPDTNNFMKQNSKIINPKKRSVIQTFYIFREILHENFESYELKMLPYKP